jgi:hypothetical protein
MKKEDLLSKAQELNILVPEKATNEEISDLIKIAEHPSLTEKVKELEAEKVTDADKAAAKILELETEKSGEVALKDAAIKDLDKANVTIGKLEDKIEAAKADSDSKNHPSYKYEDGKAVEITVQAFRFKGEKHESADAVTNPELMEELRQSGFIHLKFN